jgi:2-methylisocitrate lyase-like PEP mutase family enzyme
VRKGVPLVINARVDCFLSGTYPRRSEALDEVATRARAYQEAGADCIYPCGPGDEETVRLLRDRIEAPINILGSRGAAPLPVMKAIGVNRVSLGPHVFRSCLRAFTNIVDDLATRGDFSCLENEMTAPEAARYLREEREPAES